MLVNLLKTNSTFLFRVTLVVLGFHQFYLVRVKQMEQEKQQLEIMESFSKLSAKLDDLALRLDSQTAPITPPVDITSTSGGYTFYSFCGDVAVVLLAVSISYVAVYHVYPYVVSFWGKGGGSDGVLDSVSSGTGLSGSSDSGSVSSSILEVPTTNIPLETVSRTTANAAVEPLTEELIYLNKDDELDRLMISLLEHFGDSV